MQKLKFPKGFLWGAATSAYQVEGNNTNTDWWVWEHSQKRMELLKSQGKNPEDYFSGIACDSYNRYDEDFALAQHLNHSATRLGIEWARIEPEEGKFSEDALAHYEKVLRSAKAHGLQTFVTLHHYTLPIWLAKKDGFEKRSNVKHFLNYVDVASKRLGEYVDFWLTFNEPTLYATLPFLTGLFPPQKKNPWVSYWVARNLISAHNQAYSILKMNSRSPVGLAYHLADLQPMGLLGNLTTYFIDWYANSYMLNRTIGKSDFIGVNYYFHHHVGITGTRHHSHSHHLETDLHWGIHPEGIEKVLMRVKKYNKPVYITENGLADAKDEKREKYIKDHLSYAYRAIQMGVNLKGYLYWSLIDNFEWHEGFAPRFGLIEIDRQDLLRRKVRYSATKYAEICRDNAVTFDN